MRHVTDNYLLNPGHAITVIVAGVGGTGSMVLSGLARINRALISMGHPGLMVTAYDPDIVTTANAGRQMYSPADIGFNKAGISIGRCNGYFGTEWMAEYKTYSGNKTANIIITCVDTVASRLEINENLSSNKKRPQHETETPYYWMDIGNLQYTGQVIMGTVGKVLGHRKAGQKQVLPTVIKKYPQMKRIKDADQGPSCSLAEALHKQDLFINSTLAQFGCNLVWKLFREGGLQYHGCFVNLETLSVNPIKI